jgi:hypothetical protein
MHVDRSSFGSICIDGMTYEHDVVIDRGKVRKRKKKLSKKYRNQFGHTPLSIEENIPWKCSRLIIDSASHQRTGAQSDRHERHPACDMLVRRRLRSAITGVWGLVSGKFIRAGHSLSRNLIRKLWHGLTTALLTVPKLCPSGYRRT